MNRHGRSQFFTGAGTIVSIHNQKDGTLSFSPEKFIATTGLDMVWVVENRE